MNQLSEQAEANFAARLDRATAAAYKRQPDSSEVEFDPTVWEPEPYPTE